MKKSLGLVELKSTPIGILTVDEMLKAANVELVSANPICPGKYIILVSGNVGAVKSSVKAGVMTGSSFVVHDHVITNISEDVIPALSGTVEVPQLKALGILETMSALSAIRAGDIAIKAANITLMEIRMARGLGGKGFIVMSGEVSSVKSAIQSCLNELQESGDIVSTAVIPAPHKDTLKALY